MPSVRPALKLLTETLTSWPSVRFSVGVTVALYGLGGDVVVVVDGNVGVAVDGVVAPASELSSSSPPHATRTMPSTASTAMAVRNLK
jgi:hypothetical protein